MRVPETVRVEATAAQLAASQATEDAVCLVAGPGAGKSRVIRDRVVSLAQSEVDSDGISVVSFTRASSADLRTDIHRAWRRAGLGEPCPVRVSTLHALALRILRAAGQLSAVYAVPPRVLDAWEMDAIFDSEFGEVSGQGSSVRRKSIRLDHEAFWSTGHWLPPGLPAPEPPISSNERGRLDSYYRSRSALYCYVLPSDITRRCLEYLQAMPTETALPVPLTHLIVDEYQDLNPVDLRLINEIYRRGVHLFAAGDDDQIIYFFRYAMPEGIQLFDQTYTESAFHVMRHCFRCPDEVLRPAIGLMEAYAPETRIPKDYVAVPSVATPPVVGGVDRWSFRGHRREADAIATSCRALIDRGFPAAEIAILLSSRPSLERVLLESLDDAGVAYELTDEERFVDTPPGRGAFALMRFAQNPDDYVALRTLIGIQSRVGIGTCNEIATWALRMRIRYGDVLTTPTGGLSTRARRALDTVHDALETLGHPDPAAPVVEVASRVAAALELMGLADAAAWLEFAADLPEGVSIDEACRFMGSPTPRAAQVIMSEVFERLGLRPEPDDAARVRVMTLHGSKGLTFGVVFIPGLERDLLPSRRDAPFPGLVQQAARLLYVGMTRARLRVVLSMAEYRLVNGNNERRDPTPFVGSLSGRFVSRETGLTADDVDAILQARGVFDG